MNDNYHHPTVDDHYRDKRVHSSVQGQKTLKVYCTLRIVEEMDKM
jgi:hypothetical protein